MSTYMRVLPCANRHEDCLGLGITNLLDFQNINVDQVTMTLNRPYMVVMTFDDVNSAVRWHYLIASWDLGGQLDPRYNRERYPHQRPTILVEGDFDHVELMRRVRDELGVDWTPPSRVDVGPIVDSEMTRRCLHAQIIMHLKSLIPTTSSDQDQDLSFNVWPSKKNPSDDDVFLMVCDGSQTINLSLSEEDAASIAYFTSYVSSVRWDKLDDFLASCMVPPVFIDKTWTA